MFIGVIVSYDRVDPRESVGSYVTTLSKTREAAVQNLLDTIRKDFGREIEKGQDVYIRCGAGKYMDDFGYEDDIVATGENVLSEAGKLLGLTDEIVLTGDGYGYWHYKVTEVKGAWK